MLLLCGSPSIERVHPPLITTTNNQKPITIKPARENVQERTSNIPCTTEITVWFDATGRFRPVPLPGEGYAEKSDNTAHPLPSQHREVLNKLHDLNKTAGGEEGSQVSRKISTKRGNLFGVSQDLLHELSHPACLDHLRQSCMNTEQGRVRQVGTAL